MTQDAELTPSGAGNGELGVSVAVSGNTFAVGAPLQTVGSNTEQGAVFVYNEPASGWSGVLSPAAELTASDGTRGGSFWATVAALGSTIAVGEQNGGPGNFSHAYLFSEPVAGWSGPETESLELVASNEAITDEFGSAVALSCGTVVVGAAYHRRLGSTASQGAVYVSAPPPSASAGGAPTTVAAQSTTAALDSGRAHFPSLAASAETPASSACTLLVTDVTATSDPLSVDVHVSQDPRYANGPAGGQRGAMPPSKANTLLVR